MNNQENNAIKADASPNQHTIAHFFLPLLLLVFTGPSYADVSNFRVTIVQNETITMDLVNVISNINNPVVNVPSGPTAGNTATPVTCADQSQRCIQYDPAPTYVGTDTFVYSVVNDVGATETATVTVVVGPLNATNQGLTPQRSIDTTLDTLCRTGDEVLFSQFCNQYYNDAEPIPQALKDAMLEAISPQAIGAQGRMVNNMIKEQMGNINQRLLTLRAGANAASLKNLTAYGAPVHNVAEGENSSVANLFNKKWDWFISAKTGGGDQDETLFEDGFEFDSNTVTTGADFRYSDKLIIGAAFGYGGTDMQVDHDFGSMDLSGFSTTLYSSYSVSDKIYADATLNYTRNSFDLSRRIVFGIVDETASSETDSVSVAMSVGGGYEVLLRGALTVTATGRLDYVKTTIQAYQEKDAGIYNLYVKEQDIGQLFTTIGAHAQYAMSQSWGVLLPQVSLNWLHNFDDDANQVEGYFIADTNQTLFSFDTNAPDADFLQLSLGTSAIMPGGRSGYFQYETTLTQDNLSVWNISAGLRLEF